MHNPNYSKVVRTCRNAEISRIPVSPFPILNLIVRILLRKKKKEKEGGRIGIEHDAICADFEQALSKK